MSRVCGIDPGKSGAMVVLEDGEYVGSFQFTPVKGQRFFGAAEVGDISYVYNLHLPDWVVIEAMLDHAMTHQSSVNTNTTAANWGVHWGMAYHLGHEPIISRPADWKTRMGLRKAEKKASLELARSLYPELEGGPLRLQKNLDVAEALLIALDFGREKLGWTK